MLSDGAFYNQDKKKIADNSETFWDYVMMVEYDYHALMKKINMKFLMNMAKELLLLEEAVTGLMIYFLQKTVRCYFTVLILV